MKLKFYHDSALELELDNNDRLFICICFDKSHRLESRELSLHSNNKLLYKRDDFEYLYHLNNFEIEIITDMIPSHKSYHITFTCKKDDKEIHMEINEIELDNTVSDFSESKEED